MMRLAPCLCAAALLGAALPPGTARAADQPITFRLMRSDWTLEPDGRAVQVGEMEIVGNNDASARGIAQQSFTYVNGIERVEILEAHTTKADGRRIPVRVEGIREQLAPGVPNSPMYADLKQRVIVFPDVGAGDAVNYKWRRTVDEPLFPGFFQAAHIFGRNLAWGDVQVSLTLPPGVEPALESHGVDALPVETAPDGRRTWRWRHQAAAVPNEQSALVQVDRAPRVFISTAADWAGFVRGWTGRGGGAAAVTPEIQAVADQVTAGVEDRREQARKLYEWVSLNVRWVALWLGQDGWIPHDANRILAARYGDCKDQATLLTALLRAKGIPAEQVVVNTSPTFTLPAVPTYATFNHMITYLPEWDVYADTVAQGAPFGTVPIYEYGKWVVHLGESGAAVRRIPPAPLGSAPGAAMTKLRTEARLDAEGRIEGTTTTEGTGFFATMLRATGRASQMQDNAAYTAQRLRTAGLDGRGSVSPGDLRRVDDEYRIGARFRLEPQPGLAEGDPFLLPPGPILVLPVGEGLLAPFDSHFPASVPVPCHAGTQEEDLSLKLPPNLRPVRLPRPRRIDEPDLTYESRWSQDGDTIRVTRRLESRLTATLCSGPQREAAARALTTIRRDRQARLLLEEVDASKPE